MIRKHNFNVSTMIFDQFFRKFSHISKYLVVNKLKGNNEGITVLALNRPNQKNAFNVDFVQDIQKFIEQIVCENNTRVLIVRSLVKGVFCAGADLKERLGMSPSQVAHFVSTLRNTFTKLNNIPIPTITAIDGTALGGGLELSLATDIRIATTSTKLGLVEVKLAIIPGAGGTQRLPRLINPSIAKELIYTGRIIDGHLAEKIGLVNYCVEQNDNGDAAFIKAIEIGQNILPNGPVALKMAKIAINKGVEVDLDTGLNIEEACYAQVIPTKDRIVGLEAFKANTKPHYKGE